MKACNIQQIALMGGGVETSEMQCKRNWKDQMHRCKKEGPDKSNSYLQKQKEAKSSKAKKTLAF